MDKERIEEILESTLDTHEISFYKFQRDNISIAISKKIASLFLIRREMYEEALEILLTINKEDYNQEDEFNFEEWAYVLHLIGICYSNGYSNYEQALCYCKESLNIMEENSVEGILFPKGEIWVSILNLLEKLGRNDERQREINDKLMYFSKDESIYRNNSYIFNFNYYLANKETDINKAIEYMYTAVNNFPLDEDEKKELLSLYNNRDKEPHKVFE